MFLIWVCPPPRHIPVDFNFSFNPGVCEILLWFKESRLQKTSTIGVSLFPHAVYPLPFPISFAQSPYRSLISLVASWIFPVFTLHKWTDTYVLSYVPVFIKWTAFSHASLPFSFCTKQHSTKKTLYSLEGFILFYSFIGLHWPLYGHFNCFQHFVIINTKNAAGNNLGIIFMLVEMYLQVFLTEVGPKVKCIYSSIRYFQISHQKSCTGFHYHWPLGLFPQNLTIRTCCPTIVTFVDMVGEKWYLSVVLACWWFSSSGMSDSCNPVDWSMPGSSVHGILQTGILELVANSFYRGSSPARDWTRVSCISCIAGELFTTEPPRKSLF